MTHKITIEIEPIKGSNKYDVHFVSHQLGSETFAYRTKQEIAALVTGRLANGYQDIHDKTYIGSALMPQG
jgi:hypothetical protein